MTVLSYPEGGLIAIMNARDYLVKADGIARELGLTQAEWCRRAGFDYSGKAVSRAFSHGNCKLSTLIALLKPLGYELVIRRKGEADEHGSV